MHEHQNRQDTLNKKLVRMSGFIARGHAEKLTTVTVERQLQLASMSCSVLDSGCFSLESDRPSLALRSLRTHLTLFTETHEVCASREGKQGG